MPDVTIECRFSPEQLDIITTALEKMAQRDDMGMREKIIRTSAVVKAQRRFGRRSDELQWPQAVAMQA